MFLKDRINFPQFALFAFFILSKAIDLRLIGTNLARQGKRTRRRNWCTILPDPHRKAVVSSVSSAERPVA